MKTINIFKERIILFIVLVLSIFLFSNVSSVSALITDNLQTYYSFDDTNTTSSPNNITGMQNISFTNNPIVVNGILGNARNYTGTNYGTLGKTFFNITQNNFTINIWFNSQIICSSNSSFFIARQFRQ